MREFDALPFPVALADALPLLIAYVDREQRYRFNNRAYEAWFQTPVEELRGRPIRDLLDAATYDQIQPRLRAALRGERVQFVIDVQRPHLGRRHMSTTYLPDVDEREHVRGVYVVGHDLTDQIQTEAILSGALDALDTGIAVLDSAGRILRINQAWRAVGTPWQIATNELAGRSFFEIAAQVFSNHAGVTESVCNSLAELLAGRAAVGPVAYEVTTPEGPCSSFEVHIRRFEFGHESHVLVSERQAAPQRCTDLRSQEHPTDLTQISHMAVMDQLAAGIAHELNQPLATIANYAGGCLDRLNAGKLDLAELAVALRQTLEAALRGGEIIRRMRGVIGKSGPRRENAQLNDLVAQAIELLRYELESQGIEIRLQAEERLPEIQVDAVQMQQVLVNLMLNASTALSHLQSGTRTLSISTRRRQTHLEITVADNGTGFQIEPIEKIFEPYFTTRPGGLGMGLAISRAIVQDHGGTLTALRVGGESVFFIQLPLRDAAGGGSCAEESRQRLCNRR